MSWDDVYPVKTSKVGRLLHYVIAELGLYIIYYFSNFSKLK